MKRILIADDDASIRRLLEGALAPLAAELHFCSDGLHAMDALRCNGAYDLLITDVKMPVMDGRQLVTAVLADADLAGMPILVTSGIVSGREVTDLLHAGVCGFLAKPLNLAAVRSDVSACLGGIFSPAV
ncbi:MAG: response regulator [Krumholzibacteria bacterium]|nr:response regulator [Candidatus Krumholzibacteria bacterium]